jgi:hypothetical protein
MVLLQKGEFSAKQQLSPSSLSDGSEDSTMGERSKLDGNEGSMVISRFNLTDDWLKKKLFSGNSPIW